MPVAKHLFITVSTRQNIANLLPIVELANKGDKVLWLETSEIASERYTKPAMDVLQQFDLINLGPVHLPHRIDLRTWKPVFVPYIELCRSEKLRPVLVINGGRKLTILAVYEIWREFEPIIAYAFERPVALWKSDKGFRGPTSVQPYRSHRLDLSHILLFNGYTFHEPHRYGCVYSNIPGQPVIGLREIQYDSLMDSWVPITQVFEVETLKEEIATVHASQWRQWLKNISPLSSYRHRYLPEQIYENLYHATLNVLASVPALKDWEFATYQEVLHLVSSTFMSSWRNEICDLILLGGSQAWPIFIRVCSLVHVSKTQLLSRRNDTTSDQNSGNRLGEEFELAVAGRVLKLIRQPPYNELVQSMWVGVKVSPRSSPVTVAAEYDVLLVLKNAILIHIECKRGNWERKDLDARLANFARIGSVKACFAVCTPMFTEPQICGRANLQRMHQIRMSLRNVEGIVYLPFTLSNQPSTYTVVNENGEPETHQVETFEEAFTRLLASYVPRLMLEE